MLFRKRYPYHAQTFAVKRTNHAHLVIFSEPPPGVGISDVAKRVNGIADRLEVRTQGVGNDGWVKDLVLSVPGDRTRCNHLIAELSELAFGTSYKSYAIDLDAPVQGRGEVLNTDLRVTAEEIRTWLFAERMNLVAEDGRSQAAEEVFHRERPGVYYSEKPGLVAWWIPAAIGAGSAPQDARRFALDSDLLVGAVGSAEGVLIIGRERQIPVDRLQPLRAETIGLLDAVDAEELGQSYERRHLLAGKLTHDEDWAPIYLSPELVDTEFGSLLNITDQMLKGWSLNGLVKYHNFPYPMPSRWAFARPLFLELHADELTFNWNTRGAGYVVSSGARTVFAFHRTGALPVSYIPGESATNAHEPVMEAEAKAYEYYASLRDPFLARVVQYAGLYQVFRTLHASEPETTVARDETPARELHVATMEVTHALLASQPDDLRTSMARFSHGFDLDEETELLVFDLMRSKLGELSSAELEATITTLENPRSETAVHIAGALRYALSAVGRDLGICDKYAARIRGAGWIHTPVVVKSSLQGELKGEAVGGHNLYAMPIRFRANGSLAAGEIRVLEEEGQRVVEVAESALSRAERTSWTSAHKWESEAELAARVRADLLSIPPQTVRPLRAALDLSPPGPPPPTGRWPGARGLAMPDPGDGLIRVAGWGSSEATLPPTDPLSRRLSALRSEATDGVIVERLEDGRFRVADTKKDSLTVFNTAEDATRQVAGFVPGPGRARMRVIELYGMRSDEAEGFVRSCEARAGFEGETDTFGIVYKDGAAAGRARNLLRASYDYPSATLETRLLEGAEPGSVTVARIPGRAGAAGIGIRVKTFFRQMLTRSRVQALSESIELKVRTTLGQGDDLLDINLRLRRELRKFQKETGQDIQQIQQVITNDIDDITVVRLYLVASGTCTS
jgi:hypothetical protein